MRDIDTGIKERHISYDKPLFGGWLAQFDWLEYHLNEMRRMLTAIQRTVPIPTPLPFVPPPLIPEEGAIPDALAVLQEQVKSITDAAQGKKPEVPKFFPELDLGKGLYELYDDIVHTKWLDVVGQVGIAAKTGFLVAMTTFFGSTTFAAFMYEEAIQALGMPGWIAFQAKQYGVARNAFDEQLKLIDDAQKAIQLLGPLMPITKPGFDAFFHSARLANEHWDDILRDAMYKAGLPARPILAVLTRPSGAKLYIDDEDTLTLSPETFRKLAPGAHTVTAIIPATATKAEMGASQDITLEPGKRLEISLVLTTLEEAAPPEVPPTAPATLRVSSSPSDGAIWLDGTDTGTLTPETFKALAPGQHTVLVVVPPRGAWPRREARITVTLAPGEKREISLSPTIP